MPVARVSMPSPHFPKFKFRSSCNIFAPGHTKCIDYMLGSHNFSKMCAERPSTYSPTTIVVDSPDCPLPAADAAMLCLRAFLNRFGILGLFQPREITVVFQHHVYGKQSSGSGSYAAVNMHWRFALDGHIPRIDIQELHSSECLRIGSTNDTTGRLPHDTF
ncbi:hypothetical protein FJTKL_02723 [Diaporthe vaccinii]|uniref:Uncharacterized protein n=1 Tax=Diaporthe vaccinii TaxID=105482 RepID=A0ABR4DX61_9PEZI